MMFLWLSWGLTTQNSICTTSDLDRSRLTDTRSAENDRIGADTDPEYRIDASLHKTLIRARHYHLSGKSGFCEGASEREFYLPDWTSNLIKTSITNNY